MTVGVQNFQNRYYRKPKQKSLTECKFSFKSHAFDFRKCPPYNEELFNFHKFDHFKEVYERKNLMGKITKMAIKTTILQVMSLTHKIMTTDDNTKTEISETTKKHMKMSIYQKLHSCQN